MGINTPDIPEQPRDRHVVARRVLHVTAVLVGIGGTLDLTLWPWVDTKDWPLLWPWWAVIAGACETLAFALRARSGGDAASDNMEAGLRIGCGAIVGFFSGLLWAFVHWSGKNAGAVYMASAVVGAIVCGALALRFGDKFWDWPRPF